MNYITKEQKEMLMHELYTNKSFPRIARNVGVGVDTSLR